MAGNVKKGTWEEMLNAIHEHNNAHGIEKQYEDKSPLICTVVLKESNWPLQQLSLESRSYRFRSDEKWFLPKMLGRSIFAECLDGSETIRLDQHIWWWQIDWCYWEEAAEEQ